MAGSDLFTGSLDLLLLNGAHVLGGEAEMDHRHVVENQVKVARALDQPRAHLIDLAIVASQRSLIDFRHSGGITEVQFTELLRPIEGRLL